MLVSTFFRWLGAFVLWVLAASMPLVVCIAWDYCPEHWQGPNQGFLLGLSAFGFAVLFFVTGLLLTTDS